MGINLKIKQDKKGLVVLRTEMLRIHNYSSETLTSVAVIIWYFPDMFRPFTKSIIKINANTIE